ncbi:MAG TPA: hypothetical protein DCZ72_14195 [Armatimonadetes bacterium]|nr:hypothetical protein [Armatimonadota bacterium]
MAGRLGLSALVGLLCVLPTLFLVPQQYTARQTIMFPVAESDAASLAVSTTAFRAQVPEGGSLPILAYLTVLRSRRVLLLAAERAGVAQIYDLHSPNAVIGWMEESVAASLGSDRLLVVQVHTTGTPKGARLWDRAGQLDLAARQLAARLVLELVDATAEVADEIELDRSRANLLRMQERLATEERRLAALGQVERAGALPPIAAELESMHSILVDEAVKVDAQLSDARNEVQKLEASLRAARAATASQLAALHELPAEAPLLTAARAAYRAAQTAYDDLAARYGPENVRVIEAAAALRRAETDLQAQATQAADGRLGPEVELEISLAGARSLAAGLQRRRDELRAQATQLVGGLPAERQHKREAATQEDLVVALRRDVLQAEMNYLQSGVRWFVLDPAEVPLGPSAPSLSMAMLAAVLAAGATLALPWVLGQLRRWLSSPE